MAPTPAGDGLAPRAEVRLLDPLSDTETEPDEDTACQAGLVGWRVGRTRTQQLCEFCTASARMQVILLTEDGVTSDLPKGANGRAELCENHGNGYRGTRYAHKCATSRHDVVRAQ